MPSTQVNPAHNLDALLIGTGEFSFSKDATSVANAQARGFLDFGNIVAFTPQNENTKEEHKGSYRGTRRVDKTLITETKVRYKIKCDEWNLANLRLLFAGSDTTAFTQAAISAAAGAVLGFTASAAVIGRWYNLTSSGGARLRDVTTVTITSLVEGTDFVVDLALGRIKFLTAQTSDLTPTITCSAITSADAGYAYGLIPGQTPTQSGFGRLVCFDQNSANQRVFEHIEFSCDVSLDSGSEVDGTSYTEITLDVLITGSPGIIYTRKANQNAGVA